MVTASLRRRWPVRSSSTISRNVSTHRPRRPPNAASNEVDLLVGYDFDRTEGGALSSGTRGVDLSFGATNVFDRRPPFESVNGYSLFNDPRQRFMYLRLTKRFD
jgi:outer membrane receptor protein involved in Fe transport